MKKVNGKAKGKRNELSVAHDIADKLGVEYGGELRRTPASGALITRADLWIHPKHRGRFPFFVEIKSRNATGWSFDGIMRKEQWEPYKWFKEAKEKLCIDPEYDKSAPVILVFTKNRLPFFVMMDYDTYGHGEFSMKTKDVIYDEASVELFLDDLGVVIFTWETFLSHI